MVITAKFAGKCRVCGGKIYEGDQINWQKGAGSSHAVCPAKSAAPPAPAVASVPDGAIVIVESWEPCKRQHLPSVVGETRQRAGKLLVVLSQSASWMSADDNEDFGQPGIGASWSVKLACREANAEEIEKDLQQQIARAMVKLGTSIAAAAEGMARRAADSILESQEDRIEIPGVPAGLRRASSEILFAREERVPSGAVNNSVTIRRHETPMGSLYEREVYVYDWDQPLRFAGSREVISALRAYAVVTWPHLEGKI